MSNSVKAGVPFYLPIDVGNGDGTMDVSSETPGTGTDLAETLAVVVDHVESYGMVAYVYECRAIRKIVRGKTRVIKLKAR